MFTGLIEEQGEIIKQSGSKDGKVLRIKANKVLEKAKVGDSIATDGVCLTITNLTKTYFEADLMFETLKRSTLINHTIGTKVNLEKSLTLQDFLGGHLVYGDVDCVGEIIKVENIGNARVYTIEADDNYMKYVVEKGRITIDGASLTVVSATKNSFSVSLIPHSYENLTISFKKSGDIVNLEMDMLAKYAEKLLDGKIEKSNKENKITESFLYENGF